MCIYVHQYSFPWANVLNLRLIVGSISLSNNLSLHLTCFNRQRRLLFFLKCFEKQICQWIFYWYVLYRHLFNLARLINNINYSKWQYTLNKFDVAEYLISSRWHKSWRFLYFEKQACSFWENQSDICALNTETEVKTLLLGNSNGEECSF